jgi:hypothetical protein
MEIQNYFEGISVVDTRDHVLKSKYDYYDEVRKEEKENQRIEFYCIE